MRGRPPHLRALREHLHGVAADRLDPVDGLRDAAGRRDVGAEQHVTTLTPRGRPPARPARRALQERDFRLLFSATTITTVGDRLGGIALIFAVLEFGSATDLGLVLAARMAVEAVVLLGGGVLSDRLPRNLVLVGASLTQGVAQAITAGLVLSGNASVASLIVLQALYGVGGRARRSRPRSASCRRPSARSGSSRRTRCKGCRGTSWASSGPRSAGSSSSWERPEGRWPSMLRRSASAPCCSRGSAFRLVSGNGGPGVRPRAPRGVGRVHRAGLALEVRRPDRRLQLLLGRRVERARARGRGRGARRRRSLGDDPDGLGHRLSRRRRRGDPRPSPSPALRLDPGHPRARRSSWRRWRCTPRCGSSPRPASSPERDCRSTSPSGSRSSSARCRSTRSRASPPTTRSGRSCSTRSARPSQARSPSRSASRRRSGSRPRRASSHSPSALSLPSVRAIRASAPA